MTLTSSQISAAIRARHYAVRTERAYIGWIRRFILFHGKRHPDQLAGPEITEFLTSLAVDRRVSASTQNQALSAILFLYKEVLDRDLPWLGAVIHAKRPERLPVMLSRPEVAALLSRLKEDVASTASAESTLTIMSSSTSSRVQLERTGTETSWLRVDSATTERDLPQPTIFCGRCIVRAF